MSNKNNADRAIAQAAREAAAEARRRAIEIVTLCGKYNQGQAATELILSGKTLEECEAELKRAANAASWSKAIAKTGQEPAAPAPAWGAAISRVNAQGS